MQKDQIEQSEQQRIPVKMYRTEERITVAAPMPGSEPEDIMVEITPQHHIILSGEVRGLLKGIKELIVDEWTVGGYYRDVELPVDVNGGEANVTYGNGVLVVALPVAQQTTPARLRMQPYRDDRGERAGNAGHPPHPQNTAQHQANAMNEWLAHGGNLPAKTPHAEAGSGG
jgi:HSP20 family protein